MSVVDYNRNTITQDEINMMKCLKASGGFALRLDRPEISEKEVAHPAISDKDYAFTLRFGSPAAGGCGVVHYSTRTQETYEAILRQLTALFGNHDEEDEEEDMWVMWDVGVCYEAKEAFEAFIEEVKEEVKEEDDEEGWRKARDAITAFHRELASGKYDDTDEEED
jgi:hypothetical protein